MVGEGEELPLPSNISRKCQIVEVLQDRPDVAVGGFDHEADGEVRLGVLELGSSDQGPLGGTEGLVHGQRPNQGFPRP